MNDKTKKIIILILFILIVIVSILLISNYLTEKKTFDKNITFQLNGDENVTVYVDSVYNDLGFIARNKDGIDLSHKVKVSGNVDTSLNGEYIITYSLIDDNGILKKLERKVSVIYKDDFALNGEPEIYMLINGKYQEQGAKCYNNNVDYSSKIKIDSNLDTAKEGMYTINYYVEEIEQVIKRTVYVSDFDEYFKVSSSSLISNSAIELAISSDPSKVLKYVFPDGKESNLNINKLNVSTNGNYKFVIYDHYGNSLTKTIEVNNIDKTIPTVSCSARISLNKTVVSVSSNKKIVKYLYNGVESNSNNYTINGKVNSVKVIVYDEAGNSNTATCTSVIYSEKMEMHFIASGHYDDAILIRTDDKVIFIDGGRYNCVKKVVPYLQQLGIKKIDAMIGSHLHNDHVAAQGAILDNFTVSNVYYPDDIFKCASRGTCVKEDQDYIVAALRKYGKTPVILKPADVIDIGEMKLYVLGPSKLTSSQNNNSLIFILKFRNNTFMFTGDAGSEVLNATTFNQYATKMGISLKIDMFKYPHHGNGSISDTFLNAIKPKYVVVPNYNASKYPNETNTNKIKNIGAKIYRQSDYGNILLISDGNNISFVTKVNPTNYKR